MTLKMEVKGLKELDRKLRQLEPKVARRVTSAAVRAGAAVTRAELKQTVPYDSGKMLANVYYFARKRRFVKSQSAYGVGIRSAGIFPGNDGWKSGSSKDDPKNAYYWTFVEFGTKNQAPQPFMRIAFEDSKQAAARAIGKRLGEGVEREAKKRS